MFPYWLAHYMYSIVLCCLLVWIKALKYLIINFSSLPESGHRVIPWCIPIIVIMWCVYISKLSHCTVCVCILIVLAIKFELHNLIMSPSLPFSLPLFLPLSLPLSLFLSLSSSLSLSHILSPLFSSFQIIPPVLPYSSPLPPSTGSRRLRHRVWAPKLVHIFQEKYRRRRRGRRRRLVNH